MAGYAVAGGLELALLCDLRVAEEDATFGVFCRRWGVPLIDGGTVRLPRLIGLSRALDMILTGRAVGASEALQFGLANRVVPHGQARGAAEDLAREIAAFPQRCMLADRRSAHAAWDGDVPRRCAARAPRATTSCSPRAPPARRGSQRAPAATARRSADTMGPTYRELIVRGAHGHRERIALTAGDVSMTFGEVDALSSRLANALIDLGVPPRTRVGLLLNNSLLSVPVDFACVKANLNRVPLNARLSLDEHARMLADARAGVLLYGADVRDRAIALAEVVPELHAIPLEPAEPGEMALTTFAASASSELPVVDVRPSDVVLTLFTSGTTGTLKAAQHTQASYAAICRNVMLNLTPFREDDVMLHAASLIHASGVFVLPCWLRGARTVIMPSFEPARISAAPRKRARHRDQPRADDAAAAAAAARRRRTRLQRSLRYVIYGASPIPQPVLARAMGVFGRDRFFQYYGQTECPLCITVLRPEDHAGDRLRSCGKPCPDIELKLVDANGNDARGREGEIAVRAPSMMAGYFNAPELDAEMRLPGGWLRTRDVGTLDDDGFLYLLDRTSDMIVTGGYNVYPREVEDVLLTHPAVRECAVIGVADETWVEAVAAVVVTGPDASVSEEELIAFCRDKLASYKKPRRVIFETGAAEDGGRQDQPQAAARPHREAAVAP